LNKIRALKTKSGEYIPLKFEIFDQYKQLVKDTSKIYSNINLKISVFNSNFEPVGSEIKVLGNISSFENGNTLY